MSKKNNNSKPRPAAEIPAREQQEPQAVTEQAPQEAVQPAEKGSMPKWAYIVFWSYLGAATLAGVIAPKLFAFRESVLEQYLMIGFVPVLIAVLLASRD